MQVQVSDAGTLAKRLIISYTAAEVAERKGKLLQRLAGEVKLEGFRPGKAPRAVLEKRYGAAATAQAEEALGDEGLNTALREHKLRPFGAITNEGVERGDGLKLTVSFEVFPTIAFPEPKSLVVAAGETAVTETEVEEFASGIAKRLGAMSELAADETLVEDDSAVLDGTVTVDGTEIRKLSQFNHLVGGYPLFGKPPAEVIAAFAGKKVGDAIAFATTLPDNFSPAEHAGKTAQVAVTVGSASRMRPAALDDALAQKVGAKDLADLKTTLTTRITERKRSEVRAKQLEELAGKLLDTVTVELPPKALAESVKRAEDDAAAKAKDGEADQARAEARARIEKSFKRHCVMVALGDHMNIQVTDDDFREQIVMAAQQTGRRPQDIAEQLQKSGQAQQVAMEIREAKAIEGLLDQVLAAAKG